MHSTPQPYGPGRREVVYALGFSQRKRSILRSFLGDAEVHFVRSAASVPPAATIAVWGNGQVDADKVNHRRILHIEDGFLRSVGLGADLARPLSLTVDEQGLYYDATRPSDLESILQNTSFDAELLQRAARLRERIVAARITKYNVGTQSWTRPAGSRTVVAVIGQVESDAALRYGAPRVRTNLGLLQLVRRARPDAFVIYKPHPDVLAGLRADGSDAQLAHQWCDEIVTGVAMDRLIDEVDEVHVLTSLAGFEALLRGRPVFTYGQPFYAGWGLTYDALPPARRTRHLTLDELAAGTLILYPRYVSPRNSKPITPEQALDALIAWRDRRYGESRARAWLRHLSRGSLRLALRTLMGQR